MYLSKETWSFKAHERKERENHNMMSHIGIPKEYWQVVTRTIIVTGQECKLKLVW